MGQKRTAGFWTIFIVGILFLVFLLLGQTMSFIHYDFTVSLGLQESEEIVGEMGVAVNKGFGVGDTLIYVPILIIGIVGLWLRRMWGVFAMVGALAITAYWPMVVIFMLSFAMDTPGFKFTRIASYTMLLSAITVYGLWGMWYLCARRKMLVNSEP